MHKELLDQFKHKLVNLSTLKKSIKKALFYAMSFDSPPGH